MVKQEKNKIKILIRVLFLKSNELDKLQKGKNKITHRELCIRLHINNNRTTKIYFFIIIKTKHPTTTKEIFYKSAILIREKPQLNSSLFTKYCKKR